MRKVIAIKVDLFTGTLDSHFHTSKRAIYSFVQQMFMI